MPRRLIMSQLQVGNFIDLFVTRVDRIFWKTLTFQNEPLNFTITFCRGGEKPAVRRRIDNCSPPTKRPNHFAISPLLPQHFAPPPLAPLHDTSIPRDSNDHQRDPFHDYLIKFLRWNWKLIESGKLRKPTTNKVRGRWSARDRGVWGWSWASRASSFGKTFSLSGRSSLLLLVL